MIPHIDIKATGENIKALMKSTGVTPTEIKEWCNFTTVKPIYHWIHGRHLPSVDSLVILACMFGCKVDDIIVIKVG